MQFLTDFADQAVILPLVVAIAASLSWWPRGALVWLLVCGATLGAIGAGKLMVFRFGPFALAPTLLSPSGHVGSAALVYGGLAALLLGGGAMHRGFLAGGGIALVIGMTRVGLGVHSIADVIVGGTIGTLGAVALVRLAGPCPIDLRRMLPIAAGCIVALVTHGLHLPAEIWLRTISASGW